MSKDSTVSQKYNASTADVTNTNTTVLVLGAGPVGLINARTLVLDGFQVTIIAKEDNVGGTWRKTYPDLTTNSPWGVFSFSGLDMPKPSNLDGKVVPARAYRRYLEDFYHYFVEGKADIMLKTKVTSLVPTQEQPRGWTVTFVEDGKAEETREFDKVVLAVGYIGTPYVPDAFQSSSTPVFHTATLSDDSTVSTLLDTVSTSHSQPTPLGDSDTVLVVGGGKSGMDAAAWLTNRGKKVIWAFRGPLKWSAPAFPPGTMGANRLDILFGPSRYIYSWAMWLYHCTSLGARLIKKFWTMMRGVWSTLYTDTIPAPSTDPHVALPHFAGGIPTGPTDFISLVRANRIAVLPEVSPTAVHDGGVTFQGSTGNTRVRCGAIVAATGYQSGTLDFIEATTRKSLGLEREPASASSAVEVGKMRRQWKTIDQGGDLGTDIPLPLVLRGILPLGRLVARDLAMAGATKPFSIPAITYEVESHWISSLFKGDPFLRLPKSQDECLKEIHADNDFIRARYPGVDPYAHLPAGSYYSGFNDLSFTRTMLRDLSLDPWRQKEPNAKWWRFWSLAWLDVRASPEQYATIGEERAQLRRKFQQI